MISLFYTIKWLILKIYKMNYLYVEREGEMFLYLYQKI